MVDLIKKCLLKDPNERITIPEMLEHPWITSDGSVPLVNEKTEENHFLNSEFDLQGAITRKKSENTRRFLLMTQDMKKMLLDDEILDEVPQDDKSSSK